MCAEMEIIMKKYLYLFMIAVLGLGCLTACSSEKEEDKKETQQDGDSNAEEATEKLLSGKYSIEIDIKDYGVIKADVDADIAPITVTNFINLVKEGFYDGLTFHRIINGFVMQEATR